MMKWPSGKRFAFTVFDDTDLATLDNVPPVYAFLADLGFRTTKSVWPTRGDDAAVLGGATADDEGYRSWTLQLQDQGFEIGSHGTTYHTSSREQVIAGLDRFRDVYGHAPMTLANHDGCRENVYWGVDRVTGIHRLAYQVMTRSRGTGTFRGHVQGDPLFWGDVCRSQVRYVRNFTYAETDTLAACPMMPYHDPLRPYVAYWFASSEGRDADTFSRRISEAEQDRLEAGGGACIMYTHFASGFWSDGRLHPRFRTLMERLAAKDGWFVPVATLLDHLRDQGAGTVLTDGQRRTLERRWLMSKARVGHS